MFAGPTSEWIGRTVITVLLVIACASDLRARRIPNALVVALLLLGTGYELAMHPFGDAIARAGGGLIVGLLIWMPFYALRMIGAGDVKLFAAGAVWLGARLAIDAALVAAIVGAVLSLVWLVWSRGLHRTLVALSAVYISRRSAAPDVRATREARGLPYAVALATGLLGALWFPSLVH